MGFPRQKYWSRLPFPTPGIFLAQRSNPYLLCLNSPQPWAAFHLASRGRWGTEVGLPTAPAINWCCWLHFPVQLPHSPTSTSFHHHLWVTCHYVKTTLKHSSFKWHILFRSRFCKSRIQAEPTEWFFCLYWVQLTVQSIGGSPAL